jgi:hypothetical protein
MACITLRNVGKFLPNYIVMLLSFIVANRRTTNLEWIKDVWEQSTEKNVRIFWVLWLLNLILDPEEGGNTFLRNICNPITDYTTRLPTVTKSSVFYRYLDPYQHTRKNGICVVKFQVPKDATSYSRGNSAGLYSGDTRLKSWSGHRLSWLKFAVVVLSPSRQMLG